jgi:cytochrome b561
MPIIAASGTLVEGQRDLHGSVPSRYTRVAIVLHWLIAALILFNLALGFFMEGFRPALRFIVVGLHISSGITVLALTVLRLVWRLVHRPPQFAGTMASWERATAHAAHWFMYFLMVAMPLTGWSLISARPPPAGFARIWSVLPLPMIAAISRLGPSVRKVLHPIFVDIHSIGGWIFITLLVLHAGAALKHQFYDKQAELARMGIGQLR